MAPGTMVGGFRVERLIASGSTGTVYEATQLSLRRAVALRVIPARYFSTPDQLARFDRRQRQAAALYHPNLVPCYEVGEWEGGRFLAMRLIRGKRLADLCAECAAPAAPSLTPVAGALEAAHAAGLVHGNLSETNVLIEPDGMPYLADLGLSERGSPEEDAQALAGVTARLPAQAARPPARTTRHALRLGLAGLAAMAVLVVALTSRSDEDPPAPAALKPLGCREDPSPNTPECTLAQATFDGRAVVVPRAGVIRSWTVRGASGELAIQVIRKRRGQAFAVGFSQPERLTGAGPWTFQADIGVRPGDRLGVRLGPGAVVGTRPGSPGATVQRWDGGLTAGRQAVDATLDGELMLRADIAFGAGPEGPRQLRGRQAASAPAGRTLSETTVPLAAGRAARVAVVELPGAIAIDVFHHRRLSRLEVPDADRNGEFFELEQSCGPVGGRGFCLRWRNPGADVSLIHEYSVGRRGRLKLVG